MNRVPCSDEAAALAADIMGRGGVAVFPTDTVYGIGCDPYNRDAVRRIYGIKGRDASKALPVLVRSEDAAGRMARMGPAARELAARFWPGPLTMVLEVLDLALEESMGLDGSIAVRVPAGRCIGGILQKRGAVVGTSANESGAPPPVDPDRITVECDVLLDGGVIHGGRESTIVDATGDGVTVVRRGAIPEGELGA